MACHRITALVLLLMSYSSAIRNESVRTKLKTRTGRQWTGDLAVPTDCSFQVEGARSPGARYRSPVERVSLCNFTSSTPQSDGVYAWQKGLASQASWLGGPKADASGSAEGGYAFFETSSLSVQQLPGIQAKAWLKSPVYEPTTPNGHCLRFSYNMQGVSASQLKLMRVQMVPLEGHSAAPQHRSATLFVNSILLPTTQQLAQSQRLKSTSDAFAAPWTPFRAVIVNQTGWQEVVDQVWLSSDSTGGQWAKGHVTYSSPYPHAFMFEAVPNVGQLQYRGHVALDDVQFSDGPCQAECEFNSDLCQWSNEPEHDDFDWSLSRGSLWTSTGPIRDQLSSAHNFNFGGYAYIDSRQPHFAGSRAVMTSQVLPATEPQAGPKCFVFWVHAFGAGIGRLRLLQRAAPDAGSAKTDSFGGASNDASQWTREIWRLPDNGPRDSWYRAQVTLTSSSPFQIQLEATVGESGYGDIGLDSFRLESGPCPGLPEWAVNRGIDCTFQANSCSWVMTNSQPGIASMWTRATGDVFAGRPEGHAQFNVLPEPTNGYMMFDTFQNGHRPGSRGYLSALLTPSNEKHCLSFWYYMASNTPSQPRLGALEVQLFEPNVTSRSNGTGSTIKQTTSIVTTTLWRLENHQLEKWLFARVPLVPKRGGYVSFVGVRAEAVRGAIAIDDVTIFKSDCSVLPQEASVSQLDCTFDHNLCKWAVDSRSFEPPLATIQPADVTSTEMPSTSSPAPGVSGGADEITPLATTTAPLTTTRTTDSTTTTSTIRSTVREDEPSTSAITDPSVASSVTDDTTPASIVTEETWQVIDGVTEQTSDSELATTTIQTGETVPRTAGTPLEPDSIRGTGEVFFLNFPGKADETSTAQFDSTPPTTEIASAESTEPSSAAPTTVEPLVVLSSTTRPTQAPAKVVAASPTRPASKLITLPGNKSKQPVSVVVGESVKNGTMRRVGLYDEVTSFGVNAIEVISTTRDGATKSIIISQPVKTRFRRDSDGWRGFNRDPRIVNSRANDPAFRRTLPVPHWLRPRAQEGNARGVAVTHSAGTFLPMNPSHRQIQPSRPLISLTSPREPARWMLSSGIASLHGVKDHTFNLAEGGYAFLETQAGQASVSRLFSPEFSADDTYCLTFFFTTAYNSPNTTLTVYRDIESVTEELWRVTSAALDRLDQRLKSPWIPARVPVPKGSSPGNQQTIIIEGSSDGGALALDDVRLKRIACSGRP